MRLRHNEGPNSTSSISDTPFFSKKEKGTISTPRAKRVAEEKESAHCSARLGCHFHLAHGGPPPLRFGDEGQRQPHWPNDACGITAAVGWGADACGDEDCNSQRDPPFTNDTPQQRQGAKSRPVNRVDKPPLESRHPHNVNYVDILKKASNWMFRVLDFIYKYPRFE